MIITDGSGGGYQAQVDSNNRVHVESVGRDLLAEAAIKGDAFNFNTGTITLTSASESAVGYLGYEGDDPFVITEILFILGTTTGGSGDGTAKIISNPTGGTIVSGAVDIDTKANRNFASSKSVDGVTYKGAEGNTLTGGSEFANTTRSSFGTVISFDAAPIVLKKGNSLGVTWTPPTGNTSQSIKIAATGYILASDITGI
jgi:hypothetical protein